MSELSSPGGSEADASNRDGLRAPHASASGGRTEPPPQAVNPQGSGEDGKARRRGR